MSKLIEDLERIVAEDESKLRDHFAGLALNGIVSKIMSPTGLVNGTVDDLGELAYTIADAMLKARKEVKP